MKLAKIVAASAAIVAVAGALAAFGLDLPKVASRSYVDAGQLTNDDVHRNFAGDLKTTRQLVLEQAISADERRVGDLEIAAPQIKAAGGDPRPMLEQAARLRRIIVSYESELRALRSK